MKHKKKSKLKVAAISVVIILAAAFGTLFIISGVFAAPRYLEPWDKSYYQKFDDPRIQLAAHGLLAANGHNMQPWKIRLDDKDPNVFYLYADSSRLTIEVDPYARQMMVTQGAFLEYAAIAGDELGYKTTVELFPQGEYDENNLTQSMDSMPVAKVTLAKSQPEENAFYPYMFLPDTNRAPYQDQKMTADELNALKNIDVPGSLSVKVFDGKEDMERLGWYAMQGAVTEAGVPRVMQETADIFRPNEYEKNKYRYGFSVEGQGTSGIMLHIMQGLVTVFPSLNSGKGASDQFIQSTQSSVLGTSAYAMIVSNDNSRESQVLSGMAYSRLILAAHQLGIVMQPLSQVLEEYPEMAELYAGIHREYAANGETIQMLVRMGKPTKEVPNSMRRDVMDLIAQN